MVRRKLPAFSGVNPGQLRWGATGSSAAWLARSVRDAEAAGSNPAFPTRKTAGQAPFWRWGPDGTAALTSPDGRGRVTVPADYLAEHVALAYAVTVHKAQGLTVDRALTIVDERTTLEHLYVGMTRGRRTNHALVTTSARGDEHTETPARDARRVIEGVLRRSGNEPSATELLRAGPDRRTTIARLAEQAGCEAVVAQELVAAREELNRALAAEQRLQAAAPETIKAPSARRSPSNSGRPAPMAHRPPRGRHPRPTAREAPRRRGATRAAGRGPVRAFVAGCQSLAARAGSQPHALRALSSRRRR